MRNETLVQIGKRLTETRKARGYTQEQLSDITGLSTKMLSAAENGHKAMRPESIIKICESLKISSDYLLFGSSQHLNSLIEQNRINRLSQRQKEALSKIIDDFLSAFDN